MSHQICSLIEFQRQFSSAVIYYPILRGDGDNCKDECHFQYWQFRISELRYYQKRMAKIQKS